MFSFNRETMTVAAIVVALALIFYMYQESQKMKKDISECKTLAHRLASVQAPAREVSGEGSSASGTVSVSKTRLPPSEEENED